MPDWPALSLFVAASMALLLTPWSAVLYIVARSLDQGRRAGIVSTLGIGTGTLVHVASAALGLSALLVSSSAAFGVVKILGALYLIYLGLRRILVHEEEAASRDREPTTLLRIFGQGVVVNVLNPKTALFFFAFLPQFVDPSRGSAALQIRILGTLFVLMGIASDGVYALMAGTAGGWLRRRPRIMRAQRYVSGGVLVALGVVTAVSGSKGTS